MIRSSQHHDSLICCQRGVYLLGSSKHPRAVLRVESIVAKARLNHNWYVVFQRPQRCQHDVSHGSRAFSAFQWPLASASWGATCSGLVKLSVSCNIWNTNGACVLSSEHIPHHLILINSFCAHSPLFLKLNDYTHMMCCTGRTDFCILPLIS